jgi:formate hydrogenlyase subunit 6/NADH:ubiquinone oxidoreductase subunit I
MLRDEGYEVIGPTVRDGAIVYGTLSAIEDLPVGIGDEQRPGSYRLRRRDDAALFGFAVGPHSYKREFLAPMLRLFRVRRSKDGDAIERDAPRAQKRALIGVRACEIAAMAVQDRVLLDGPYADADYAARRRDVVVIAVQCAEAGGTCFCASMGTGPEVTRGFDLALTELVEPEHRFVVEVGSPAGERWLARLAREPASDHDMTRARDVVARTAATMGRTLDTRGIRELLAANLDHPRFGEVAERCLGCANCTMACPTCFCTTVEDHGDLDGASAERVRRWDSCFTLPFSHLHGGSVRASLSSRYRQWLTHKLGTWFDQFGSSGCVGCGRCITWCPVGIDITEEMEAIRSTPMTAERDGGSHG